MFEDFVNLKMPTMPKFDIPSFSESIAELVQEKVRAIEANLKPDQNLLAYCEFPSGERIQALKIQFTGGALILVHGLDPEGNHACMMCHAFTFQMVCKVVSAPQNTKKTPIGFILPKENQKKSE